MTRMIVQGMAALMIFAGASEAARAEANPDAYVAGPSCGVETQAQYLKDRYATLIGANHHARVRHVASLAAAHPRRAPVMIVADNNGGYSPKVECSGAGAWSMLCPGFQMIGVNY